MRNVLIGVLAVLLVIVGVAWYQYSRSTQPTRPLAANPINDDSEGGPQDPAPPYLSIDLLKKGEFPGSDLVVEQVLPNGSNYTRAIVSYKSEGLKIYALLTVPMGEKPAGGWPAIVFNHGYIPPAEYRTTERYIAYTDGFSRNGYILLRPDYRGHGNSEGEAPGGYGSNAYTIDVLNALASLKKYPDVNASKIGMWGHSMGGYITLRSMVVNKDIKAGVIWAGVVASYPDLLNNWRRTGATPRPTVPGSRPGWRQDLVAQYGTPEQNPNFWNSISANSYLSDISGPLQLHHGTADHSVPVEFTQTLDQQMKAAGKEVETYIYPGDDHDIPNNFGIAMQRSVEFFDRYLK